MIRGMDRWLASWLFRRRTRVPAGRHVLIAVCDHFEPFHDADKTTALARVAHWHREHSRMTAEFRGSDGVPPRHTFFYPIEQWDGDVCRALAGACDATGAEMEIHLHHKDDTADNLRRVLSDGKEHLAALGRLSRDARGELRYGFIHGNWALDHSHPGGRACGVADELRVLRETGCYADFTLPSAPSPCQVRTINSIYRAREDGRPRSHERGRPLAAGAALEERRDELLLIQGPLALNWRWRKCGILPRVENSDLTGANPPTPVRLALWERCHIHVAGRPEWIFVKLHTHGAIERNSAMLLGGPMRAFHRHLAERAAADPRFHFHYVTAREMANVALAAEAGERGSPGAFRDYHLGRGRP
jgi:hypothetical protein